MYVVIGVKTGVQCDLYWLRLAHLGKWSRNSNRRKRYNVVFDISGFLKVVLTFPILVFPVIGCNPMRKIFMVKWPKRLVKLTTVRLQVRSIRSQCKCNIRLMLSSLIYQNIKGNFPQLFKKNNTNKVVNIFPCINVLDGRSVHFCVKW